MADEASQSNVGAEQLLMAQRMQNLRAPGAGGEGDAETIFGKGLGPRSKGNIAESFGQGNNYYLHMFSSALSVFGSLNLGALAPANAFQLGERGSILGALALDQVGIAKLKGQGQGH